MPVVVPTRRLERISQPLPKWLMRSFPFVDMLACEAAQRAHHGPRKNRKHEGNYDDEVEQADYRDIHHGKNSARPQRINKPGDTAGSGDNVQAHQDSSGIGEVHAVKPLVLNQEGRAGEGQVQGIACPSEIQAGRDRITRYQNAL